MSTRARALVFLVVAGACTRQVPVDHPPPDGRDAGAPVETAAVPAVPAAVADAGAAEDGGALAGFPELLVLREGSEVLGAVSVPLGAREPRPIMIALHGGSDRPERACPAWRIAADAYPFVVCPRGSGGNESRLGWRSIAESKAHIERATAAVRKTFGAWVKDTPTVVIAGFSMGASQVARIAESEPQRYRRIVIGDSAHDPGPALTFSRVWAASGGERAMFMCTTSGCEPSMRAAAKKVAAQKPDASIATSSRLVVAPTQVHALSARAASSLRRDWGWLVEGADGWDQYVAPPKEPIEGRTESFEPRL